MSLNQAAKSFLALSQQQELDDLSNDDPLSASEDENSDEERKHQKLLEAIRTLDGKTRPNLVQRSEASLEVSEFNISSNGSGEKLVISDLLDPTKMSPSLANVKKQLKRVKSKKIVELPLNKEELEQIHREVTFNKTTQALSKWDPIVLKNRQAEQLVFPMNKEPSAFAPIEHVLSGWKAKTPLEQELFNLLHKKKQPVTDLLLTPKEKASLKAMSLEEAKMYRAELQRARALQSYYEARARREKKIRSKKHHKMLKKGKGRKTLNEIEMLSKVSPSAALEELEKIKTARIMERMNLKHQSSGKWAKSKKIVAKFDVEVRQAMQVQLAKNKELAQKFQVASENEEVEEGSVEEAGEHLFPDAANEVQTNEVDQNPWILGRPMGDAYENEIQKDPKQLLKPLVQEASEKEKEERPVAEEEISPQGSKETQFFWQKSRPNQDNEPVGIQEAKYSSCQEVLCVLRAESQKLSMENDSRKQKVSLGKTVVLVQSESLIEKEEEPLLLQSLERAQTQEELDVLGKERCCQNKELPRSESKGQQLKRKPRNHPDAPKKKTKEQMINLQNLLTTKSPSVKSLAVPTIEELEDEKERAQKQVVKEAFAGDDVIRDFLKEKREAVETSKPKDLDLILPGWGEWDGAGLKPSAKKRRRFHIKVHEGPPRKDKNLANVIITEKRNIHMAAHQVQMLPHPFTHYQQFERTIQTPIGSTWNTPRAFQKLIIPKVVTKLGHVIKPIKAEDVGYRSSSR
ncbi:centrosomal protein CEP57L1 isoform X2 [Sorex araneus]|nr:centrosomal protein CEP57L1 isoform X2 [Sorex araneus]